MDTKHIHCMLEKMAEYGKCMIEEGAGSGNVNLDDAGKIVDMVKDLACAEKEALIAKEMRKAHEEDEEEEKHFLKILKEEKQDEYKRMKEEYGEDEGERRFYDNYRYANGRFAPKGSGTYRPRSSGRRRRRGYEEMPYPMFPEMYDPMRDLDREEMGRMYYSGDGSSSGSSTGGNTGGQSGGMGSGNMGSSNSGGSSRGYSEGYDDGSRRGYESGYSDGQRDGRKNNSGSQSRYDRAKRGYEEAKEQHKGGTSEDKQITMREAEKMVNVFMDGLEEALEDSPIEVKSMVKTKATSRLQKI